MGKGKGMQSGTDKSRKGESAYFRSAYFRSAGKTSQTGKDAPGSPPTSASACLGSAGGIGEKGTPLYPLREAAFRAASASPASASACFRSARKSENPGLPLCFGGGGRPLGGLALACGHLGGQTMKPQGLRQHAFAFPDQHRTV